MTFQPLVLGAVLGLLMAYLFGYISHPREIVSVLGVAQGNSSVGERKSLA